MTDTDEPLSAWAQEVDALLTQKSLELDGEIAELKRELAAAGLDSPEAIERAYNELDASVRQAYALEEGLPAPAPAPAGVPAARAKRVGRMI